MINRIEDIKNKRNERMDDAAFFLIKYLVTYDIWQLQDWD